MTGALLCHYSDWYKRKRAVVIYRELVNYLCGDSDVESEVRIMDLVEAEVAILKFVQSVSFKQEIQSLSSRQYVSRQSSPNKLDPVLMDGLLIIGRRLDRLKASMETRHPVLLPRCYGRIIYINRPPLQNFG